MEGDKREMRKRRDTSRSTERKPEESQEKEEGNQMEETIEKKVKEHDERIQKNTDTVQQFMEMMQRDKQEKEQRRRQKEEKEQREKQQRDEERQRERREKEERRRKKEQEKLIEKEEKLEEKREIMQKFERLEKRIIEREVNISKKIESMVRKNIKEMKEELDNKIEELHNELIKQQEQEQQQEEFPQRPEANETNQIIENVYVGKIEATTQLPIIYGDIKFNRLCKQINNIYEHLREIQQINKEAERDEIRPNFPDTCKRKADVWQENNKNQYTNVMKYERVLSNKIWGLQECQTYYPLLEGKENKNCNIYEEQKAKIPVNNQLKHLVSKITEYELCKRDKRWKWCQESDDASVRRKKRFIFESSIRIP